MKKNIVSCLFLIGLVALTSCKKDEIGNGIQFRAIMENCVDQHSKTTLNGTSLNWMNGDMIAVYGTAGGGIYTATPQSPATVAVFDNISGASGNAPFRAFYPSTLTTDGLNITLPAVQTTIDGSLTNYPMYAESNNSELAFKNLCGVLKFNLTKASTSVVMVQVTATTHIVGDYSVNYNNGNPQLMYVANGGYSTVLVCTAPQDITSGRDFYLYLPEGSYHNLSIEITDGSGRVCTKTTKSTTTISVVRSQYTTITLGENDLIFRPVGSKGGLFTVNNDGSQVWFSQGNLQYQASTTTWRFAENQYSFVGNDTYGNVYEGGVKCDNANISPTYSGWIDLFGWGTGNNPVNISTLPSAYLPYEEWGNNGFYGDYTWRTLSVDEWRHLLYERTDALYKQGTGNVNGVGGLILLPDNWTLPAGCSFTAGASDSYDNNWSLNSYTLYQWELMEAAGAVFLPAAGDRYADQVYDMPYGHYWSSSSYMLSGVDAYYIGFASNHAPYNSTPLAGIINGYSVRLVHNND